MKIKSKIATTLLISVPLFMSASLLAPNFYNDNQESIVQSITNDKVFERKVEKSEMANSNVKEGTDVVEIPDANLKAYIKDELVITGDVITKDDMLKLTSISLTNNLTNPSKGIVVDSLEGLQFATELTSISIYDQTSLSQKDFDLFSGAKKLNTVKIQNSNLSNIEPFIDNPLLFSIDFSNNQITDITPLKDIGTTRPIKTLKLSNNNISDISVLGELSKPSELTWLSLGDNNITNLDVLPKFTGLENLYIGNDDVESNNNAFTTIPNLSGLTNLEQFSANNTGITNLDFLKGFTGTELRTLTAADNKINNIDGLKGLNTSKLTSIHLNNNEISDISPLKDGDYPELDTLELSNSKIESIPNLGSFNAPSLKKLVLSKNQISDISGLKGIDTKSPILERLDLRENEIEDISALEGTYNELIYLYIGNNKLKETSAFKSIVAPKLKYIWLFGNSITDVSGLKDFAASSTVSQLYLYNQHIEAPDAANPDELNVKLVDFNGNDVPITSDQFVDTGEVNEDGVKIYEANFSIKYEDAKATYPNKELVGTVTSAIGDPIISPKPEDSKSNIGMIIGIIIGILLLVGLLILLILFLLRKIKVSENVEQSKGKATFTINRKVDSNTASDIKGRELRGTQGDKEMKLNYSVVSHDSGNICISLVGITNDEPIKGLVFLANETANSSAKSKYEADLTKWEEDKAKAKEASNDFNEEKPAKVKTAKDIKVSGSVKTSLELEKPEKAEKQSKVKKEKSQAEFTVE